MCVMFCYGVCVVFKCVIEGLFLMFFCVFVSDIVCDVGVVVDCDFIL